MWPFLSNNYPELSPRDVGVELPITDNAALTAQTYDYIIVGGGSAGCVLASRLTEDSNVRVLLVERGGVYDTWANRVPLISGDAYTKDTIAKKSKSLPIVSADNRTVTLIHPEALGGGSRVNAMIYTRGFPGEYNAWEQIGRNGWGYDKLKPYFSKSEKLLNRKEDFRGKDGPWENQTFPNYVSQVLHHVKDAASALNIPFAPDINAPNVPSMSLAALDIATDRNMQRASLFSSYIPFHVVQSRPNLKICTNTIVTRVVCEQENDGKFRVSGVEMRDSKARNGQPGLYFAKARREVVLCCGALATPQVLMLSGIGPSVHLKQHGLSVVIDSPGVGSQLKDHIDLPVMWSIPLQDSLHVLTKKPWVAVVELVKYLLSKPSLFSSPFVHMAFFLPTRLLSSSGAISQHGPSDLDISKPENVPDVELKAIPVSGVDGPFNSAGGVFTFMVCLLRPKSVGSVRLASADPYERPKVDLNFFDEPEDLHVLRKGVKLAGRLAEQIRKQGYSFTDLLLPKSESDKDIDEYIRKQGRTTYHYSCTCRMAPWEEGGVVDDELRVWGVKGLRVADTSVFPEIIAGHTMAPAVMIAERCADFITATWLGKGKA